MAGAGAQHLGAGALGDHLGDDAEPRDVDERNRRARRDQCAVQVELARLVPGDEITITTGQAENVYEVFGVRRPGDPLPEPVRSGEGQLELITGDGLALLPSGTLHIDANLVSEVQPTPSKAFISAALPTAEQAMGVDGSDWITAVFCRQWLIIAALVLQWLRRKWGGWQTWLVSIPILLVLAVTTADAVMDLLPNLI